MTWYPREEAAVRAGVEPDYVDHLVDLGIIVSSQPGRYSVGDVRRLLMVRSLEDAAIPLEHLAEALRDGSLSLDFLDTSAYERFATYARETFREVSRRTGIPLELLTAVREAIGSPEPSPDDLLREDEMAVVPLLELHVPATSV